jgi:hypothetical protein
MAANMIEIISLTFSISIKKLRGELRYDRQYANRDTKQSHQEVENISILRTMRKQKHHIGKDM